MAYQGLKLTDTATGEILEFIETSKESSGKHSKILWHSPAGSLRAVEHIHEVQDEIFEVVSGEMTYTLNKVQGVLKAGEKITLPKGIRHEHYNGGTETLVYYQVVTPSLDIDILLENIYGLAVDGKIKNGDPPLLQALQWIKNLESKTYLAALPVGLQKFLAGALNPVGKMLGYKPSYDKYTHQP